MTGLLHPDAERGVLAALILYPDGWAQLDDLLRAEHFDNPRHRAMFRGIESMVASGEEVDPITLADRIARSDQDGPPVDQRAIEDVLAHVMRDGHQATVASIGQHADIVRLCHDRRVAHVHGTAIAAKASHPGSSREDLTTIAATAVEQVGERQFELANAGDVHAMRLFVERIGGKPRTETAALSLDLGELNSASDIAKGATRLASAVTSGAIDPDDAQRVAAVLEVARRAHELGEIEERLTALEANTNPYPDQ